MSRPSSSPDHQNGSSPRTLQKMIEAACNNRHGCTWSHVLQYLKANAIIDHSNTKERTFRFETPLATYYIPGPSLAKELASPLILKTALAGAAPQRILAALCQLDPLRVQQPDHAGRLPIHLLCRYPPTDAVHAALQILIPAYPESLVTGDSAGGRTPLHYMLQYHAEKRTVETLQLFLQKHWWPAGRHRNSQRNPLLVPDTVYGALPLHYAAAHRASTAVMHALVHAAPATRHAVDATYGRTALHWYVGRALPTTATGETNTSAAAVAATTKNSSGAEAGSLSPTIPSVATIQQLKSSRAVRTVDVNGRTCLHDACAAAATATECTADWGGVVAALLEIHVGLLVAQDTPQQQTPLLVLLDTAAAQQQAVWEEQQQQASSSPETRAPQLEPFRVPWLHLLLKGSGSKALQLEDASGRLPLHAAVACGLDTFTEAMITAYPPALLHVDERLRVPLHCALAEPWSAALQTPESLRALLLAHTAMEHVDGRLAMKMEDGDGSTPLHYACTHAASVACVQVLLEYYPQAAYVPNPAGDLPLQCAVWSEVRNAAEQLHSRTAGTEESEGDAGTTATNDELVRLIQCLVQPLLVTPSTTLPVADSRYGMTPLHILVLFRAASYDFLLKILELHPPAAAMYSTAPFCESSPSRCSPLDLHDLYGDRENIKEFQAIRELLYSFHPTAASHRHRQELLDACVQIIVEDVAGNGSVHHERNRRQQRGDAEDDDDDDALCISHTVSNMERTYRRLPHLGRQAVLSTAPAVVAQSSRPQRRRHRHHRSRRHRSTPTSRRAPAVSYSTSGGQRSSVYDDDDTGMDGYSMSGSSGSSLDTDEEEQYTTGGGTDDVDDDDDYDSVYSSSSGSRSEEEYSTVGDQSRSLYTTDHGAPTGTTTFEEDATRSLLSEQTSYEPGGSYDARTSRRGEEKKDDGVNRLSDRKGPGPAARSTKVVRPSFFSEVSMRLWTFFVLHRDADNPNDNYVKQLSEIIEAIDYPTLELLVTHPVPQYAKDYLPADQPTQGLSFGDLASPKCRELIHKTCFFLGRYDFRDTNASALVHQGWKDTSVLLEWTEWIFTTEEEQQVEPGMAEKSIWATGAVPAEVGLTFRKRERPVWILFTKNRAEYEVELDVRRQLGIPVETVSGPSVMENDTCIVPILNHYNAIDSERKEDRMYHAHIRDPRFRSVVVGRGEIQLTDYPYALVFEKPKQGTVAETIRKCGVPSPLDRTQIAFDVATAVNHLHSKGTLLNDPSNSN